jgi:multidrug efflux pump
VDDAIIVVEQIDTHLHSGWDKLKAVTSAYVVTAQPMLIGTLVTMLGFLPIALARSAAGEYASSIFAVVAIALGFSWIVAVFITPFIAEWLLPEPAKGAYTDATRQADAHSHGSYDGPFYQRFRGAVRWALTRRRFVMATTAALFLSIGLFAVGVPETVLSDFRPPELIVDLRASQNASFAQTLAVTRRLEKLIGTDPDVTSVTSYVGAARRASTSRSTCRFRISRLLSLSS